MLQHYDDGRLLLKTRNSLIPVAPEAIGAVLAGWVTVDVQMI